MSSTVVPNLWDRLYIQQHSYIPTYTGPKTFTCKFIISCVRHLFHVHDCRCHKNIKATLVTPKEVDLEINAKT